MLDDSNDNNQRITRLIGLDLQTGIPLWEFNKEFLHGDISYFASSEVVYIGTEDGYVFALESDTGHELWKAYTVQFPSYFILDGSTLIVAFYDEDSLAGLDAKTGQEKWKTNLDIETIFPQGKYNDQEFDIRSLNNALYLVSEEPAVYALNSSNGKILWSWNHSPLIREHRGYTLELLDNGIIYIIGGRSPFDVANYGLFALQAEP